LPWPLVKDLLQADAALGVHPDRHLGHVFADAGVFRHQFQFFGLHAIQRLCSQVLDLPFLFEISAAGAEAEHEPTFVLAEFPEDGHLVDQWFIELDGPAGDDHDLGHRLAVHLADVRGHLEGRSLALVVDRALLYFPVGYRVGGDSVELEVGRGGVEVGRGSVEFAQHLVLRCFFWRNGKARARRQQQQGKRCDDNDSSLQEHRVPYRRRTNCWLSTVSC